MMRSPRDLFDVASRRLGAGSRRKRRAPGDASTPATASQRRFLAAPPPADRAVLERESRTASSLVEFFTLESRHVKRTFRIALKRPGQPVKAAAPIMIVLDSAYTFGTAVDSVTIQGLGGLIEPAVVVGVGYDADLAITMQLRDRELTPSALGADVPESIRALVAPDTGGADAFVNFLLSELIPAVVARVPEASPRRRILFGHSLGGLFVAHVLMTRPDAFETFVAASPCLWWNDFEVMQRVDAFRQGLAATEARPRVLVTVGAREQSPSKLPLRGVDPQVVLEMTERCRMVDVAGEFASALKESGLADVQSIVFADEGHASVIAAAVGRAVGFALGGAAGVDAESAR